MLLLLTQQPPRGFLLPHCSGLRVVGAGAKTGMMKRARSAVSRLAEAVSVRADGDACITGRARAGAGAAEKRLRGKLSRRVAARLWHKNLHHRTVLARSLHVQRRKACRALSAPAYRRQRGCGWIVRFFPCIDAHQIAHAHMRHDWIPASVLTHAMHLLLGILPPATQGAFGRSGKYFKQAPYLGRSLPSWLYQAKILLSVLFLMRV